MALINCGECGNQVSDKAVACPRCGNPIALLSVPAPVTVTDASVITTQSTGKGPKVAQLVGGLMFAFGFVAAFSGALETGGSVAGLGLLLYVGGRFTAWWGHG